MFTDFSCTQSGILSSRAFYDFYAVHLQPCVAVNGCEALTCYLRVHNSPGITLRVRPTYKEATRPDIA